MIDIILCDDDKFILKLATERIREEIVVKKLAARIVCTAMESAGVLQYISKNKKSYLVFLDLDFGSGKLNGIDAAKQIKAISPGTKVVFVTNHQEMAMQVLSSGVEPFGFLEKTTDMNKLSLGFARYIQMAIGALGEVQQKEDTLELHMGIDEKVSICKNQILYVETEKCVSHGVSYHTLDGSCITVRDTIDHVSQTLGETFIRIHRSILVNKNAITGLDDGNVQVSNGQTLPCTIRMRKEVRRCLL